MNRIESAKCGYLPAENSLSARMKILVFAPHSETWVHSFPEALVAEALQKQGHEVRYVTCGGLLEEFCVPMASHALLPSSPWESKQRICKDCHGNAELLSQHLRLEGDRISDLVSVADREEIARSLDGLDRESVMNLERDGIPVGKLSLFNSIIRSKRADYDFTDEEWEGYLSDVRTSLYALKAGQKIFERHKPDRVLVYNSLYAAHGVIRCLGEQRGVPSYFIHAGQNLSNRLQTVMIGRGDPYSFAYHLLDVWPKYAKVPCRQEQFSLVTGHILELLRGKSQFVYSSPKLRGHFDIRQFFGVRPEQKIVVAILSSYDEAFASQSAGAMRASSVAAFRSQADWIDALVAFAAGRPDIFLIIRVHPRELPNRREKKRSQHAGQLAQALERTPDNCKVNWPADGVSVYDLAGEADVFLCAWSTVGKEASFLGIPVLGYVRDMALYPDDLHAIEADPAKYFGALDQAISDGWSLETARRAYRWGSYEFWRTLYFIDDGYPRVENGSRSLLNRAAIRLARSLDPQFNKRVDLWRRSRNLAASSQIAKLISSGAESMLEVEQRDEDDISVEKESEYLLAELRRIAFVMFPSPEAQSKNRLFKRLTQASLDPTSDGR
jgi:hypothetical protein